MIDPHRDVEVVAAGRRLGEGRAVVVLVHGRNAGPANILDLVPRFDRDDVTWLAPAAAGRTWYPLSFMAPRDQNEPWLTSALEALSSVVRSATAAGVTRDRIVLAGFSQGACLATEFALRYPGAVGGLVAFSGGLIGPPGTAWPDPPAQPGLSSFFGCSDVDQHVPWPRVAESAAVFERSASSVDLRQYRGLGHVVCDDEIAGARIILDRAIGER
jgi:phospholipase/carboxylesterase